MMIPRCSGYIIVFNTCPTHLHVSEFQGPQLASQGGKWRSEHGYLNPTRSYSKIVPPLCPTPLPEPSLLENNRKTSFARLGDGEVEHMLAFARAWALSKLCIFLTVDLFSMLRVFIAGSKIINTRMLFSVKSRQKSKIRKIRWLDKE